MTRIYPQIFIDPNNQQLLTSNNQGPMSQLYLNVVYTVRSSVHLIVVLYGLGGVLALNIHASLVGINCHIHTVDHFHQGNYAY